MKYFIVFDPKDFNMVRGLLNYISENIYVVTDLEKNKLCGMFFSIKDGCEDDWRQSYKDLVSQYAMFKELCPVEEPKKRGFLGRLRDIFRVKNM